jgi:hypothetical protein
MTVTNTLAKYSSRSKGYPSDVILRIQIIINQENYPEGLIHYLLPFKLRCVCPGRSLLLLDRFLT